MARRELLVQLDDDVVRALDEMAARLDVSRSQLLRRGARAVLEAEELLEADRKLVESYRRFPQDPAFVDAAFRLAREAPPEWSPETT